MRTSRKFQQTCLLTNSGGYNLLMTSIALIVVGLLSVAALQAYSLYKQRNDLATNQLRVADAISKIQTFKETYGRYPCPSSLNAARGTEAYGHEDCTTVITMDSCLNGVCRTSGRTIAPAVTGEPIRIGAIPFRLLQIEEKASYDAYGSRLVYAMTENLGATTTFKENNGAIGVLDENGGDLIQPADSVEYIVISPGPNKMGGFTFAAAQPVACAAGFIESRNCIDLAAPPASPTRFASSQAYLAGTAQNFDDTVEYFASNEVARWRRTDTNLDDIQTISNVNVGVGGITDPDVTLDIRQNTPIAAGAGVSGTWDGALRVTGTGADIRANSFCNETGTECFKPENFATTGMGPCPANQYMIGIEGNGTDAVAKCAPIKVYCNPTNGLGQPQALTGLTAAGAAICSTIATNCALSDVQVCAPSHLSHNLKSSNEGGITHPTPTSSKMTPDTGTGVHNVSYYLYDADSYASNRAWGQFTCNNGNWLKTGSFGGMCSCTPVPPTSSTCTASPPSATCTGGGSCVGAGTGSSTVSYTYSPSGCGWTTTGTSYASCACPAVPPSAAPGPTACPTGYNTGAWIPGYNWNDSPSVCAWVAQAGTCACDATLKGSPPAGTPKQCNQIPGFEGYSGTAPQTFTFNATAGACRWEPTGYDTSGCLCDTTTLHPEAASSTCNAACQNETTQAKNWYRYAMPGCVKTLDHTDPSVCQDKLFTWQPDPVSPPLAGQSSHGPYEKDSACNQSCMTNNVVGSTNACWGPDTGGTFKIYSCICKPAN